MNSRMNIIHTTLMFYAHYYNSNLIWRTVSFCVDEVIPSDHLRREVSRVIQWFDLIQETWYCTPDQVTIIICFIYTGIIGVRQSKQLWLYGMKIQKKIWPEI